MAMTHTEKVHQLTTYIKKVLMLGSSVSILDLYAYARETYGLGKKCVMDYLVILEGQGKIKLDRKFNEAQWDMLETE